MYKNADILKIENIQPENFFLTWKMTGWCNYHCPYCINSETRDNFSAWIPEELMIEKAKRLNLILKKSNVTLPIKLKLIGGEVSYYNLPKILDEFERLNKLIVTTNFSNSIDCYKEIYKYCKGRNISLILILSYHEENAQFKEKVVELTNWCRINKYVDPQISYVVNKDFNVNILDYYKTNNISKIKLITQTSDIDGQLVSLPESIQKKVEQFKNQYTKVKPTYKVTFKDNTELYLNHIYELINNLDLNGLVIDGYNCNAGVNKLTLSFDDTLYLNRCGYSAYFPDDFIIGSIWDENIKLTNKPIVCKTSTINKNFRCRLCSGISISKCE